MQCCWWYGCAAQQPRPITHAGLVGIDVRQAAAVVQGRCWRPQSDYRVDPACCEDRQCGMTAHTIGNVLIRLQHTDCLTCRTAQLAAAAAPSVSVPSDWARSIEPGQDKIMTCPVNMTAPARVDILLLMYHRVSTVSQCWLVGDLCWCLCRPPVAVL